MLRRGTRAITGAAADEAPQELRFAELLREHRLARRMTQGVLAERARLSIEAVSALERGFRRAPQRQTVTLLAQALGLVGDDAARFAAAAVVEAIPAPRRRGSAAVGSPHLAASPPLPAGAPHLIGRERDLAASEGLVRAGGVVTIVGTGGIGKTELALALARRLSRTRAFDELRFVSLGSVAAGGSVVEAIARVAGVAGDEARLIEAFAERKALLVLDNCEHVSASAAAVVTMFAERCPAVAVVATSRQPLGVDGEAVYRLAPLETGDAVRLFVERAIEVDPTFELTATNAPIVAEICTRLDGIALAIELAARRVHVLDPAELRRRLVRRFRLLANGTSLEPRQQTLRSLIDWSYELLSPSERRFFERLSVFAGGFSIDGACAVALDEGDEFDALDLLDSLTSKSLVIRVASHDAVTRFNQLETLRAYGAERLAASPDGEATKRRFVAYVDRLFREAGSAYESEARVAILADLDIERDNFVAALDAAADDARTAARLFTRVSSLRRLLSDADIIARALGLSAALDEGSDASLLASLWMRCARARSRTDPRAALPDFERAVALARESGDRGLLGRTLVAFAIGAMVHGLYDEARMALAEAGDLATSAEARKEHRHTETLLALYSGDRERAAVGFAEIADRERDLGNGLFEFDALVNLAQLERERDRPREAMDAITRAEPLFELAWPYDRRRFLVHAASCAYATGDVESGLQFSVRAIDVRPHDGGLATACRYAALGLALRGSLEAAARLDGFAVELGRRSSIAVGRWDPRAFERLEEALGALGHARLASCRSAGSRLPSDAARALVAEASS